MLYSLLIIVKTVESKLEMNGNTADLYWMPLDGGGGTVCPDSICALRTAQHSTAQVIQSSSVEARRTVASEKHLPQRGTLPFIRLIRLIRPIRPIPPSWAGLAASLGALRASESSLRRAQMLALPRDAEGSVFKQGTRDAEGSVFKQGTRGAEGSVFKQGTRDAEGSVFQQGNAGRERRQEGFHFFELGGAGHFSDFELKST